VQTLRDLPQVVCFVLHCPFVFVEIINVPIGARYFITEQLNA